MLHPGFTARHQVRREFGLSYRTKIGNDTKGDEYGYTLHLIYNALAAPSARRHITQSDSPLIEPLSWSITTRPVILNGSPISAHFEFSSTKTSTGNMRFFERVLYGSDSTEARMPTVAEILDIYETSGYGTALYGISTYA